MGRDSNWNGQVQTEERDQGSPCWGWIAFLLPHLGSVADVRGYGHIQKGTVDRWQYPLVKIGKMLYIAGTDSVPQTVYKVCSSNAFDKSS